MQGARDKEKARVYSRQYYWDHRDEINAKRNANRPESAKVYREKNGASDMQHEGVYGWN